MNAFSITVLFLALVAGTLWGCRSTTSVEDVQPDLVLPSNWYHRDAGVEPFDPGWCEDFGKPDLLPLLEKTLAHNLDLRIAERRLDQARAVLRQRRAARHPRVGLSAEAEAELGPAGWEQEYEISLPAAYEVDLWGRIRAQITAAEIDLEAAEYELVALKILLVTEAAELYFELARIRSELRLLDEQIENADTFLELTHVRHRQGMANAIDVVQQQQQIEQLRETRLRATLDETLVQSALAALLGEVDPARIDVIGAETLPDTLPQTADFVPGDLLVMRPDVHSARLRVIAADERITAALAERLPRLQLSASLAMQAMSVQQLFEFLFVTAAGTLSQSIWEGGRTAARVDEESSIRERQLLEFSAVLLTAIREVEDTLARGQALHEILAAQKRQLESAREALDLAREQYRAGILDYLRVLTALQSVQRLELAELSTRRALLSQRIQLCRAAGGYWPSANVSEEPS